MDPIPAEELVHLHVHSEYSLLDGSITIPDLIDRVKALGQKAVAVTDHGNMHGAIEFYTKAKASGIKAILGAEIFHAGTEATAFVAKAKGDELPNAGAYHLVLLAKSQLGYKQLIKVVSDGYLKGMNEVPIVPEASLDEWPMDLIALSSCLRGEFGYLVAELRRHAGKGPLPFDAGEDHPASLAAIALKEHVRVMLARYGEGNYYVELIDNRIPDQRRLMPDLVAAARHFGLPLVASADAHYLDKDKAEGHAVLMGIKHGLTMSKIRGRRKGTQFHMLDAAEMHKLYGAWPEALVNQAKIADQCNVEFKFGQYFLPKFATGSDESAEDGLKRIARTMLEERFVSLKKLYGEAFNEERKEFYRKRLEYELDVIAGMGFPGYFLIVQDFINWAKKQNIPVGPGRGSGAGSLVAYALRITDLDPIPYNLLFERFLNPERISMPDFDVDFCQDRRDEVIRYVISRYGASNVAQITTFGKMNAKAVVRDVGRVLELGFGRVDRIARLIPEELGITLDDAIAKEPKISEEMARDEAVADLIRLAKELEGLSRHCSVHAAGIVMSDGPMTDYVPVYTAETDGLITQYEMKMAEKVGLVKFDFLGLKTLTVIQKAVELIRRDKHKTFDIELIPMDDKKVYQMITAGNTVGVFQLESSGMRNLVMKLKPSCFEDVIALVALFRPGPLGSGMVDDFIECKHGRKPINYPHPWLEDTLKETYGVILYQEQVMKVAGQLASYSLGEADLLRRAMGKKIAAEMEKQKSRFMDGASKNGIDVEKAAEIFDLMAEFANYGFNKSHSAAYGLIAYQTAYLKAHYPEEFMAAIMTCDLDNTKKIVRYADECRRMRTELLPPNINRSILEFEVRGKGKIDFGLAAIKGIGPQAVQPLLDARKAGGEFKSLADLARRCDLTQVGKKTLELLCQAGALDLFGIARPKLHELLGEVVKFSEDCHAAKKSGQRGLFDEEPAETASHQDLSWELTEVERRPGAPNPEWLKKEKALLGVFLTGHPVNFHLEDKKAFGKVGLADLAKIQGKAQFNMVCVLAAFSERMTQKGKKMASLRLEDPDGAIEAVMFEDEIPEEYPAAGSVVVVRGSVSPGFDDRPMRVRVERITPVEEMREEHVKKATVRLRPLGGMKAKPNEYQTAVSGLKAHLGAHPGDTPLTLILDYQGAEVTIDLKHTQVALKDSFVHGLGTMPFASAKISYQLYGRDA